MSWWGWLLIAWAVVIVPLSVIVGRVLARRDITQVVTEVADVVRVHHQGQQR